MNVYIRGMVRIFSFGERWNVLAHEDDRDGVTECYIPWIVLFKEAIAEFAFIFHMKIFLPLYNSVFSCFVN